MVKLLKVKIMNLRRLSFDPIPFTPDEIEQLRNEGKYGEGGHIRLGVPLLNRQWCMTGVDVRKSCMTPEGYCPKGKENCLYGKDTDEICGGLGAGETNLSGELNYRRLSR